MDQPADFRELLEELARDAVEFLLIGGYAVAFHGRPRATKHIDVFLEGSAANLERAARALGRFGAPANVIASVRGLPGEGAPRQAAMRATAMFLAFLGIAGCTEPALPARTPKPAESPPVLTVGDILALEGNPPPATTLTVVQARRDLDVLRYLLERAYVGSLPSVNRLAPATRQGLDAIRAAPPLAPAELCRAIDAELTHSADGHLHAHIGRGPSCSRTEKPWAQVGKNIAREKNKTWTYEERLVGADTVGILAISGFDNFAMRSWEGFEGAIESARRTTSVIIDMRGNGGGDPIRGYQLAARLMDATIEAVKGISRRIERTTPEAYALGMVTCTELLDNERIGDDRRASLAGEINRDRGKLRKALAGGPESAVTEIPVAPIVGPAHYAGTITVLVDEYCESACETVAFGLQAHPRTRLVGRTTDGAGQFSNAMYATLPNSGIRVVIPEVYFELANGRVFPEQVGITPNILVEPGHDALDVALELPLN